MSDPLTLTLIYMLVTFILGLGLGWVLWALGTKQQLKAKNTEVDFWRDKIDQSQVERQSDINKIQALEHEQTNLKKRLAAKAK